VGWEGNTYRRSCAERGTLPRTRSSSGSYRCSASTHYRAVIGSFVHPRFVRRAICPKCGIVKPPNLVGKLHQHGTRNSAAFIARMVRVPLYPVEERDVDGAIGSLDEQWIGGVFVPDELLGLVAVA
jgi:hypothetical protein